MLPCPVAHWIAAFALLIAVCPAFNMAAWSEPRLTH
jgi:hypothetical protein